MKTLKLLDLPRKSQINLKEHQEASDGSSFLLFHRIDGRFSYCATEFGNTCHLNALQEIEQDEDGFYYLAT